MFQSYSKPKVGRFLRHGVDEHIISRQGSTRITYFRITFDELSYDHRLGHCFSRIGPHLATPPVWNVQSQLTRLSD